MLQLSRKFLWVSAICWLLTAVILSTAYRHFQLANLKNVGERDSVALTQSFANTLGADLLTWVTEAASMPADEIKAHARTKELLARAKGQMRGTDVAKVKIYGLNGNTVFSSELKQIGEDKSNNGGFQRARSGKVATELTHRDTFSAFEQVIAHRNLLATYIPIRDPQTAKVAVVFELYNDVTELLAEMERTGRSVMTAVALVLAAVFGALYGIVRHADRLMQAHVERLHGSLLAANASSDELAQRLQETVAQLDHTNAGMAVARASARKSDQARSELVAQVASAVREPLERMVAAVRQMADTRLDSVQRAQMDSIRGNSELLRKSVMNLLERANANQLPPELRQPVAAVAVVAAAAKTETNLPESTSPVEAEFRIS